MAPNAAYMHLITGDGHKAPIHIAQNPLGGGADANIYQIDGQPDAVAKIYHDPSKDPQREDKIRAMLANPPHMPPICEGPRSYIQIAWPTATIEDSRGRFTGYAMPLVDLKRSTVLENLLAGKTRKVMKLPEFYGFRVVAAANLAAVVEALHACGHHIIDLKPVNLNVYTDKFYIALLDCDGLSIAGDNGQRFHAHQYTDGYIAPEALQAKKRPQALGEDQDRFALAVNLFQLLNCGIHPYQGVPCKGANVPPTNSERIQRNLYAYGLKANQQLSPTPWSIHHYLEDETRELFDRAFSKDTKLRPSAELWKHHLHKLADPVAGMLKKCPRKPAHGMFTKGCGFCHVEGVKHKAKDLKKTRRRLKPAGTRPRQVRRPLVTGRAVPPAARITLSPKAKISIAGGLMAFIIIAASLYWYVTRNNIHRVIARNDQATFFKQMKGSEFHWSSIRGDDIRNAMVFEDERMFCTIIENMWMDYVPYDEEVLAYLLRQRHDKSLATYIKHVSYPGIPDTYNLFHTVIGTTSPEVIESYRKVVLDEYIFPREKLYAEVFLRRNIAEIKTILRWGATPYMDIPVSYHRPEKEIGNFFATQGRRDYDYRYHLAEKLHTVKNRVPNYGYLADAQTDTAGVRFLSQRYANTFKVPGVSRIRDIELTVKNFEYAKKHRTKTPQGTNGRETSWLEYKLRPLTIAVLDADLALVRFLLAAGTSIPSRIPDHASIFDLAPTRKIFNTLKAHKASADAMTQALMADDPEKLAEVLKNPETRKISIYKYRFLIDTLQNGSLRCFDMLHRRWKEDRILDPWDYVIYSYRSGNPMLMAYCLTQAVSCDQRYTYEQIKKERGRIHSGMKNMSFGYTTEYQVLGVLKSNPHHRSKIGDLLLQMAIEDKAWGMSFVIDDIGSQWTDLHLAVLAEDRSYINTLLENAPGRIEERDAKGRTPLALAVQYQCSESYSTLMKFKPEVDAVDDTGFTPLMHAISYGNAPVVRNLLDNGAALYPTGNKIWRSVLEISSSIKELADEVDRPDIKGIPDTVMAYAQDIQTVHKLLEEAAQKTKTPPAK